MADGASLFAKFASRYSTQRKKAVGSPAQKDSGAADGRTVISAAGGQQQQEANSAGGAPAAAAAPDAEPAERDQTRQRDSSHYDGAAPPGKRKAQQQAGRARRHEAPVAIADALGATAAAGRAAGARRNALTSALSLMKGIQGKQQGRSAQAADAVRGGAGAVRAKEEPHAAGPRTAAAAPVDAAEGCYDSGHAAQCLQAENMYGNAHGTGSNDQQTVVKRLLAVRERLQQEQGGGADRVAPAQLAGRPAALGPSCSHSSGSGAAAGASGAPVSRPVSRLSEQLWHSGIQAADYFEAAKRHLHKVACAANGLR